MKIHQGYHQLNKKHCRSCGSIIARHEEKQTDSRIASLMVADAMADRTDTLILIGGDSDHVPPVQTVRAECPDKDLLVCWPPARKSNELLKAVGKEFYISAKLMRSCQFPDRLDGIDGWRFERPAKWK